MSRIVFQRPIHRLFVPDASPMLPPRGSRRAWSTRFLFTWASIQFSQKPCSNARHGSYFTSRWRVLTLSLPSQDPSAHTGVKKGGGEEKRWVTAVSLMYNAPDMSPLSSHQTELRALQLTCTLHSLGQTCRDITSSPSSLRYIQTPLLDPWNDTWVTVCRLFFSNF